MSYATVLGVVPGESVTVLAKLQNAHGWAPSVWNRLLRHHNGGEYTALRGYDNDPVLLHLWRTVDTLPGWERAPLILTFDTGVIPRNLFRFAVDKIEQFDGKIPAPEGHVNHAPAVAALLRSDPDVPFVGIWGTSVTENPFEPDGDGRVVSVDRTYKLSRSTE